MNAMDVSGPAGIRMCYGHDKTLCIGTVTVKRVLGEGVRGEMQQCLLTLQYCTCTCQVPPNIEGNAASGPKHTLPYNTVCEPQRLSEAMVYNINKKEKWNIDGR